MASFWGFAHDRGGLKGILPIICLLRQLGYEVEFFATGVAADDLRKQEEVQFTALISLDDLPRDLPSVIISTMCLEGNLGPLAVEAMRNRGWQGKAVFLQDYWGSGLSWHVRPDFIITNDSLGRSAIEAAWPDFVPDHIIETGFPALDQYVGIDFREMRLANRRNLELDGNQKVVLFAGQLDYTNAALNELVAALKMVSPVLLIPRPHPRMVQASTELGIEIFRKTSQSYSDHGLVSEFGDCPTLPLLFVADLVVSMYSTTLLEAAVMRKAPIAMMYPAFRENMLQANPGLLQTIPIVSLGCCKEVTTREELIQALEDGLSGKLEEELQPAQEKYLRLDGKNTQRVIELIESIL